MIGLKACLMLRIEQSANGHGPVGSIGGWATPGEGDNPRPVFDPWFSAPWRLGDLALKTC